MNSDEFKSNIENKIVKPSVMNICEEITSLSKQLDVTEEVIRELETKLEPLMTKEEKLEAHGSPIEDNSLCSPLNNILQDKRYRIIAMTNILTKIINSIDM